MPRQPKQRQPAEGHGSVAAGPNNRAEADLVVFVAADVFLGFAFDADRIVRDDRFFAEQQRANDTGKFFAVDRTAVNLVVDRDDFIDGSGGRRWSDAASRRLCHRRSV